MRRDNLPQVLLKRLHVSFNQVVQLQANTGAGPFSSSHTSSPGPRNKCFRRAYPGCRRYSVAESNLSWGRYSASCSPHRNEGLRSSSGRARRVKTKDCLIPRLLLVVHVIQHLIQLSLLNQRSRRGG
jgi:hypothetical protein